MPCPLCSPTNYVIGRSEFWTIVLNEDQGYLGRCYFALNRHETDLTRLKALELSVLWEQFGAVKMAIDGLWQPEHYNYVFLMNVQPHLHGHIIPRYATDREFAGVSFVDGNLGKHYSLENEHTPSKETLSKIASEVASAYRLIVGESR